MSLMRVNVSLIAVVGLLAASVAAATIWLLLTDPVRAADAAGNLSRGSVGPFIRAIGDVIVGALRGLVRDV